MKKINMLSKADMAKGQGVLSAHDEQVALVKEELLGEVSILENSREACQITHYHSINPEFYLFIGKRKRQGAAVGSVHFLPETVENSIALPKAAKKIFYKYMISFYKRMDYLVTVNPVFIEKLAAYGIPREKITYIPNVVSEEAFYPMEQEKRQAVRREYGLLEKDFVVLCAGQLQKRKGVFDFVETAKRMPDVSFVWAGGFSFGKISEGYGEIKELMKNLPENVKFLGLLDREKMNEVYNMADVMFLPSYEELFPMTILEAMNCAVPVVVRDLPDYQPILFDYVLKGGGQEEFAELLRRLKEEPEFYEERSRAAFQGHEFYSRKHVGELWKKFYRDIFQRQEASDGRKEEAVWRKPEQQYI